MQSGGGYYAGHSTAVMAPPSPQPQQGGGNWKSQIIAQIQQRNQKEVKAYADIFGAYSSLLASQRQLKHRAYTLEQEIMTTRQLSSLTATPGMGGGGAAGGGGRDFSGTGSHVTPGGGSNVGGGGGGANVQKLEEKILKLQEDLTSAYRLQSENSNTFLRLKEQAEKDEKALLRKEEELDKASRSVISLTNELSAEKQRSIERNRHLEQTCELLRGEVQGTRAKVAAMEAKLKQLTVDNDTLLTTILKLKEEQSNEQNELNTVKQELVRATAEAKHAAEVKKSQEEKGHIQPQEIDVTDMNALIDHVAWTSNFNVVIPTERKRTIRGHRGPVTCIRYNTAGTLFASAGVDGLVKIYDARTGGNRASLRGTKDCVMNVAFSQDDALMLASGNDSISRIWSLKTSRVMHTLVGHTAKIWAGTFTAQGNQVVTGSHDRTLKIWDVEDGACKKSILCQSSCNYLSLSRNDNILATAHLDTHVRFWSLNTGELMYVMEDIHNGQATSVEFSKDGSLIVTCSRDNTVKLTDIRTYKVLKILEGSSRAPFRNLINWNRAIFSPDDRHVVAGGHAGEVFIWNAESGKLETILPGVSMGEGIYGGAPLTPSAAGGAGPSPQATAPSSASLSSAAAVAAANTVGEMALSCVDWNRNGRQVMSCDNGGNIHVWEGESAK